MLKNDFLLRGWIVIFFDHGFDGFTLIFYCHFVVNKRNLRKSVKSVKSVVKKINYGFSTNSRALLCFR